MNHSFPWACIRALVLLIVLALPSAYANEKFSLKACLELALREHPSIKAASGTVAASQGQTAQAASPYYPHVRASTGYSESHALGALGESVTKSYAATLSVDQLLYDFGRTGNPLDAAQANLRASESEQERTVQDVVLGVKQAYYALLQAEKLMIVAQKSLEQAESHLKQAEAFFRAGSKPRFDVTRAEVEVNNSRLGVINAKNDVRLGRITLNNAMGTDPAAPVTVEDILFAKVDVPILEQALVEAGRNRPELRKAEAGIEAAQARIKAEQSNYLPNISANGSYSLATGKAEMGMAKGDIGNSWNAGVTLTLPLFEGGLTRGRVGEARANLIALEAQRESLKQSILFEVNRAYADLENAAARMDVMEVSLKKARENLDIAQGRYQAGVGPYIEVTDAQVSAVKAETDHVQAQYDYLLAMAKLEKATGSMKR